MPLGNLATKPPYSVLIGGEILCAAIAKQGWEFLKNKIPQILLHESAFDAE